MSQIPLKEMRRQPIVPKQPQGYKKLNAGPYFELSKRSHSQKRNVFSSASSLNIPQNYKYQPMMITGIAGQNEGKTIEIVQHSDHMSQQQLPNLVGPLSSLNIESHIIKPPQTSILHDSQVLLNSQSSISPSLGQISVHKINELNLRERFVSGKKRNNLNSSNILQKNSSKAGLSSNPSQRTMMTYDTRQHLTTQPSHQIVSIINNNGHVKDQSDSQPTVQGIGARYQSEETHEEWSQLLSSNIQNLHQSLWRDGFDGIKARFMTDFEKQKLQKQQNKPQHSKKTISFKISDEHQAIQKRNSKIGQLGPDEQIKRSTQRIIRRKSRDLSEENGRIMQKNNLALTVNKPSTQRLDQKLNKDQPILQTQREKMLPRADQKGGLYIEDQDQRDFISTLNNSTEIGRALYTKQERDVLPKLNTRSLNSYQNNLSQNYISPGRVYNNSIFDQAKNNTSRGTSGVMSRQSNYGSVDQIKVKAANFNMEYPETSKVKASSIKPVKEQSPGEMGQEVKKLFRDIPGCNPFKILAERSAFKEHIVAIERAHQRQKAIHGLTEKTKTAERSYINDLVKQKIESSSASKLAETVNININLVMNQYNQKGVPESFQRANTIRVVGASPGKKLAMSKGKLSEQTRISRRKMLEPFKVSNKLLALESVMYNEPQTKADTFVSMSEKMGQQNLQIRQVRQFVDAQIQDELKREKIKQSLEALQEILQKQGLTFKEILQRQKAELEATSFQMKDKSPQRLSKVENTFKLGLDRFDLPSQSKGFDFVQVLECSSSLAPLIKYQRSFQERSKHRYQSRLASESGKAKVEDDIGRVGAYQNLRKTNNKRLFKDQDESIANFIGQVKRLIFLHDQSDKAQAGIKVDDIGDESDFDMVAEPEIYQSDSGESKYSNEDKEEKDHLAVGEKALVNGMAKYKNADKIIQKNEIEGKSDKTSHLVHYMNEMNRNGHAPKAFGFLHRKHSINEIDGSNLKLSDEQSRAIAGSLDRAKYVSKLILRNTDLTDQQGITILRAMNRASIKHLDISKNPQLTRRFYNELFEILADPACSIDRLELEGNLIGDTLLHELIQALLEKKNIVYLNVSRNKIEDSGARDLALLIQECPKLRLLFMHYNRVLGFGGAEIAEAIAQSKSMQVFDISWNAICSTGLSKKKEEMNEEDKKDDDKAKKKKPAAKPSGGVQFQDGTKPAAKGFSDMFARGFGEAWSDAFSSNKSLLHVDMSHNKLGQTDVEIIAEGLKENQQILGCHFAGNEGEIDNQGFVKPGKPLSLTQGGIVMSRLPTTEQIQIGIVRGSQSLELSHNSKCWLCEGWTEHLFQFEPGQSDDNPNHDEFKPIKLHLDIDHFDGDLMMKKNETAKTYEVHRMLPPGKHRYFFSVDGKPCVAKDQAKTTNQDKREKKMYLDMSILENKSGIGSSQNPTPKSTKKATPKNFREKQPLPEKEPEPDYYELNLSEVNYVENIHQTRTIYSSDQLEIEKELSKDEFIPVVVQVEKMIKNMNCVPRPGPKGLGNRQHVRTPWNFSLSVFASYKIDTPKMLNDCFEMDWKRTKVDKIVKSEEERAELKEYCRSIYKQFREVYKFLAGSDPMGDIFCIGVNVFSEICTSGMEGFVDGRMLKVADLDLERIKTNANEQNSKFNPKNNLVRHNFLEVFMRLCDQKYLKMHAGGEGVTTMPIAFKMMFETECLPYFSQFDSQKWRRENLWREEVDFTLKISLDPLRSIYKKYIGKNSLPGANQFMSFSEFSDCIISANCQSDNFGGKQIGNMYNLAMMTQVDEVEKDKHINMIFVEFLEAIVRVADKAEIPHCVRDEFVWGQDEIAPDLRDRYASRDIVSKLEALILFLIRSNLTPGHYTKYLKSLESYKGMGLFANDLDTGNLNLSAKRS